MSVKNAQDFLKRLNEDEAFSKRFFAASTEQEKHAFLKAEGYQFNEEDLKKELPLEDHVLDQVAGGGCEQCANGWRW